MKSDGTEPRRLAAGGWPSWSQDSTRIYYHSRADNMLCSIPIGDQNAEPKRIMVCGSPWPSVSPDDKYVAYLEDMSLKVKDLKSQVLVAEWPAPPAAWGGPAWSPAGDELCMGGGGMWIYRPDKTEPVRVLGGEVVAGSWAPNGEKLVFHLIAPYFEVWAADLNPDLPSGEVLGPGQTREQYHQDMVELFTRRIEADPHDAYAYSCRARHYDGLHDQTRAKADMTQWRTIVSEKHPVNPNLHASVSPRYVINSRSDRRLVFSVGRWASGIRVLHIALEQKGRCEMKSFEIPMVVTSVLGCCLLSSLNTSTANAGFTFGAPTNLGPAINGSGGDYGPCLSADGLELYFFRGDAVGSMWLARRATRESEWEPATLLGPTINASDSGPPFITPDGLMLFLDGNRPGTYGSFDLWVATRASVKDEWNTPINLGATVNSSAEDWGASLSSDGLELYFTSNRPGGQGNYDLWMTTRATVDGDWGAPVNLGSPLSTSAVETFPSISADGLVLFFASGRPGGYGNLDLYMARRVATSDPWGAPVNLGATVNSAYIDNGPKVSADGSTISFFSFRPGGFGGGDIWQIPILPAADFNADGKVDAADMALLLDNWAWDEPLCDIGPFPWGDGIVDGEDLKVFHETHHRVKPYHSCSECADVPCNVTLSWMPPVVCSEL